MKTLALSLFVCLAHSGLALDGYTKGSLQRQVDFGIPAMAVSDLTNQGATGRDHVTIVVSTPLNVVATASPTNSSAPPLTVRFSGQAAGGPTGPSDTTDDQAGTVSAQGQNFDAGEVAANAFDNSSSSKWLDLANANPSTRASWIQYQYAAGSQRVVTSYTITSANDAPERDPADWRLLGSNEGGANWTTLDTRTGQTFSARYQKRAFTVSNTMPFNMYRLQIDRVANPATANSVQLSELGFIGIPHYLYYWSFGDGTASTLQNPEHSYINYGSYLAVLGVSCGPQTGTNTVLISIGAPLGLTMAAAPAIGPTPLTVWFSAQGFGGNGSREPYDTTDEGAGTVTARGNNPPDEVALKAFDNTTGTKWLDFATADPATRASWIQCQYAGGLQCVVSKYTVASANDLPDRDPANWRFLGSIDGGTAWTVLDVRTNQVFFNRFQPLTFTIANTNAYNLYRLQIDRVANPATANSVQLSELQFIGNPAYRYSWSFGDGSTSTAQNPQHTYASNGTYSATLTVSDGSATVTKIQTVVGLPSPSSGSLQVTIAPAEAVSAGAGWQVDGGSFQSSGTTLSNLPAGSHIASFSSPAGLVAPAPVTLVVESGKTTLTTVVYGVQPPLVSWRWAPTNQVVRKYPKLANYHHGSPISADTAIDHYSERLAQWDVVIIPSDGTVSEGLSLHRMRESNPRIKLLTYLPYGQEPGGRINAGIPKEGPNDWYCRLADGRYSIPFWGGHFMNPSARDFAWPKYAVEFTGSFYLSSGLYDGVFLDCLSDGEIGWVKADLNGDGLLDGSDDSLWRRGQDLGLSLFRSRYPAAMVGGNAGNPWSAGCPYFAHVNVVLQENALGNELGTPTFDYVWQGYRTSLDKMQGPVKYYLIAVDVRLDRSQAAAQELQSLTADDLRRMRFGLGITLLDEGYFAFDRGDCLHGQLWWFDEYDADLGDALGSYQKDVYGPGLHHRYFRNGLVLVNSTGATQTVDLQSPVQDVTTKVTSRWLAIPPSDARVLLGAVPRLNLPRWVCLETPESRVVYQQAQTIRLEARAYAAAGIARVEFYDGSTLVETKTSAPFTCNWSFAKADNGFHVWTAKVVDTQGIGAFSTILELTVNILADAQNPQGALRRQVYRGIAGYTVADLTASAKFRGDPDIDDWIGSFESADVGEDNYGEKLSGYLIPPLTGSYVFYLASDDSSQLFLSTNENAANKRLIVQETWNLARNWLGLTAWWDPTLYLPSRASNPINLEAGRWYYVEALHKEASGGDYVAVAWKAPGEAAPSNGSEPISGKYLAYRPKGVARITLVDPTVTGSGLAISLTTDSTAKCAIDRSLDLIHWEMIMEVTPTNSITPVKLPMPSGALQQFYRARCP